MVSKKIELLYDSEPHKGEYEIIIIPNDKGGYYARTPDIPSIFTGGMSEEEALKNAKEAIKNSQYRRRF